MSARMSATVWLFKSSGSCQYLCLHAKKNLINEVKHIKRFFILDDCRNPSLQWSDYSHLQYLYCLVKGPSDIYIQNKGISQGKGKDIYTHSHIAHISNRNMSTVMYSIKYAIINHSGQWYGTLRRRGGKKRWIITKNGTGQKRNPVKGIMEVSEKEGHRSKRGKAICSWGIIAVMCVGPTDPLEQ